MIHEDFDRGRRSRDLGAFLEPIRGLPQVAGRPRPSGGEWTEVVLPVAAPVSVGCTSDHAAARAESTALALAASPEVSTPSLCLLESADRHSIYVVHHTTISSSSFIRPFMASDAFSFRHRGIIADESQNLIFRPPALQGGP